MSFGLSKTTIDKIQAVFGKHSEIEEAILYGSRAMGNFRIGSDIDLVLKGGLSFDQLLSIETQLDDQMLPYKIDLSIYNNLKNSKLIAHIKNEGKVFYLRNKHSTLISK